MGAERDDGREQEQELSGHLIQEGHVQRLTKVQQLFEARA